MSYVLREYQLDLKEAIWESIAEGFRLILAQAPTGSGKCLGKGTPILMFNGSVLPVENVRVGDKLMGPDSRPRAVLSLARGSEMMYRVSPVKGDPYIVNESHILSLKKTKTGNRWPSDVSGKIVNIGLLEWAKASKSFRHTHKGWRAGVDFPSVKTDSDLPPYLLGLWLGDGTSRSPSITINESDLEITEYIASYAETIGAIVRVDGPSTGRCATHHVTYGQTGGKSNRFKESLRRNGLIKNKHVPESYKVNDIEVRLGVLAGLMDSDGSLAGNGYDFISKFERLADDVCFLARSAGLAAYKSTQLKTCGNNGVHGIYYRVSISGDCDKIPCLLDRKKAKPRKQKKSVLVTGIKVAPIGVGNYYGFEIDGDHLFMLGDFTVTHNTVTAADFFRDVELSGGRGLFLLPRRELVYQSAEKLIKFDIHPGIIMAGEKMNFERHTQLASFDTLHARAMRTEKIELPAANFVAVDEAHLSMADTRRAIIEAYPNAIIVGLTATPARTDGKAMGDLWEHLVLSWSTRKMVEQGYLVDTQYFGPSEPDLKGIPLNEDGDYQVKALSRRMRNPKLIGDIVDNWLRLASDRQTVVFCVDRAHARHTLKEFLRHGVKAEYVDGETPLEERRRIFKNIEHGVTQVLVNVFVATFGLDIPSLSCAIIARPTKSLVLYLQIGGRVLRPVYMAGMPQTTAEERLLAIACSSKPDSMIIDHSGVVRNHGKLTDDIPWALTYDGTISERKKAAQEEKQAPKEIKCENCNCLFTGLKFCPNCGHQMVAPGEPVPTHKAELVEIITDGTKANKSTGWPEKCEFFGQALGYEKEKGFAYGFAANKYREKFGVFPNDNRLRATQPNGRRNLIHGWLAHVSMKRKFSR